MSSTPRTTACKGTVRPAAVGFAFPEPGYLTLPSGFGQREGSTSVKRTARRLTPLVALALVSGIVGVVLGGTGTGVAASTARPTNQQPPTIAGTPEVGKTLTAREGTWTGAPTDYDYAWRRCDADGGSCSLISAAKPTGPL